MSSAMNLPLKWGPWVRLRIDIRAVNQIEFVVHWRLAKGIPVVFVALLRPLLLLLLFPHSHYVSV